MVFDGGDNASSYALLIYHDDSLLKKTTINKNDVIISSDFFKVNESYELKVVAYFKDIESYSKSDSVTFKIKDKESLKSPFININPFFYKGRDIILSNPNQVGDIYYTLNGDDPKDSGIKYERPISISENTVVKAYVKDEEKHYNDSIVSTYNVNLGIKDKYRVYINVDNTSPVKNVLDSIRELMINKLKKYGVITFINSNNAISDAKSNNVDLYYQE